MFEFNIAEAFVRVILNAMKESDDDIKFGMKRTEITEEKTTIKITINGNLVTFVVVSQKLNVFVNESEIFIGEDDNEFNIAISILANLS